MLPEYFLVENVGQGSIENVKVLSNHVIDTYSIDSILSHVLANAKTDKEKALALWQFMTDYVYSWSPAHCGYEVHQPLKLLNVYGYGLCDDSARVLANLWQAADLRARIWALTGHVVPEVFYSGKWHMLDSDHKVYYTSGTTILGVRELENYPKIVERTCDTVGANSQEMARLYTTRQDNSVLQEGLAIHLRKINVTLRPAESWQRYRESRLGYYDACQSKEPPQYANSVFTFRPDFKHMKASALFYQVSNLGTRRDHPSIKGLGLLPGKLSGYCIYRFSQPFIGVDGTLRIRGRGENSLSGWQIWGSRDRRKWSPAKEITHVGSSELQIGLREFVYGRYNYWLKIDMNAATAADVYIDSLEIQTITQSSPLSFPIIQPGENRITVDFEALEETEKPQLLFEYVWEEKVEKRPWWKFF